MRCDEFEQKWNEALDARQAPQQNPALTAHAALCPHCAELLSTSDLLARAFPPRPTLAPSAGWREATVRACVVECALQDFVEPATNALPMAQAAPSGSQRRWYVAVALAAGLLIAVFSLNRPANQPAPQPLPGDLGLIPNVPPMPKVPNKRSDGTPAILPATESTLALASLNREQLSWVGYQVSDGLRPVTMGVSNAWQSIKPLLYRSEMEPEMPQPQENGRSSSWMIVRECYV